MNAAFSSCEPSTAQPEGRCCQASKHLRRGATTEEDVFSMIKGQLDHSRKRSGWHAVNVWREVTSANTGNHPARKNFLTSQKLIKQEAAYKRQSGLSGPVDCLQKAALCTFPTFKTCLFGLVCVKEISKTLSRTVFPIPICRVRVIFPALPLSLYMLEGKSHPRHCQL